MAVAVNQKADFAARINRINAGKQFEHADVIGHHTQSAYKKKFGDKNKKPKRTLRDRLMVLVAFLCGVSSVLVGRLIYFNLTKFSGLPESFYSLQGRGMAVTALILALILIVVFQLFTRSRLQSLALGCALMHFGEAAVASTAPHFYATLFPADYVAAVADATDLGTQG